MKKLLLILLFPFITSAQTAQWFPTPNPGDLLRLTAPILTSSGAPANPCPKQGSQDVDSSGNLYICPSAGGNWVLLSVTPPGTAVNPYSMSVSGVTTESISAATHGQGVDAVAYCFNSASPAFAEACNYTRDASGNLVFTFDPNAPFTGVIQIGSGGGTSLPIACVGTPGNTTGLYRQQCQTSAGALYACNNSAGCTVAVDWVAQGGSGCGTVIDSAVCTTDGSGVQAFRTTMPSGLAIPQYTGPITKVTDAAYGVATGNTAAANQTAFAAVATAVNAGTTSPYIYVPAGTYNVLSTGGYALGHYTVPITFHCENQATTIINQTGTGSLILEDPANGSTGQISWAPNIFENCGIQGGASATGGIILNTGGLNDIVRGNYFYNYLGATPYAISGTTYSGGSSNAAILAFVEGNIYYRTDGVLGNFAYIQSGDPGNDYARLNAWDNYVVSTISPTNASTTAMGVGFRSDEYLDAHRNFSSGPSPTYNCGVAAAGASTCAVRDNWIEMFGSTPAVEFGTIGGSSSETSYNVQVEDNHVYSSVSESFVGPAQTLTALASSVVSGNILRRDSTSYGLYPVAALNNVAGQTNNQEIGNEGWSGAVFYSTGSQIVVNTGTATTDSITVTNTNTASQASFELVPNGTNWSFGATGSTNSTLANMFYVVQIGVGPRFRINNSGVGYFYENLQTAGTLQQGTELSCATGLTTDSSGNINGCVASDEKLKANIRPFSSTARFTDLTPHMWEWKDPSNRDAQTHAGFVAQEVEKKDAVAVISAGGNGDKGLDYGALLALAEKTMAEDEALLKKQQLQINQLQREVKKMKRAHF